VPQRAKPESATAAARAVSSDANNPGAATADSSLPRANDDVHELKLSTDEGSGRALTKPAPPSPAFGPKVTASLRPDSPRHSPGLLNRKGPGSGRGVSFFEQPAVEGKPLLPVTEVTGHSAESVAFSSEGLLAAAGGSDNPTVRIFSKGVGCIGALRHTLTVEKDTPRPDSVSTLSFAYDAGGRTQLLLAGTRTERYLLGFRISKSPNTPPARVMSFATGHSGPLAAVCGFIGLDTVNFEDASEMYFCTCSKGGRDVKFWSFKGALLCVVDVHCWTAALKISPDGKRVAVLACGGGAGCVLSVTLDKKKHAIKVASLSSIPVPSDTTGSPSLPKSALVRRFSSRGAYGARARTHAHTRALTKRWPRISATRFCSAISCTRQPWMLSLWTPSAAFALWLRGIRAPLHTATRALPMARTGSWTWTFQGCWPRSSPCTRPSSLSQRATA